MTAGPVPERRSSGYSLDEAARIRRMLLTPNATVDCPRCTAPMEKTRGADGQEAIWFLRCPQCARSMVIRE